MRCFIIVIIFLFCFICRPQSEMEVFHCCSGLENPFYLSKAVPWALDAFWKRPFQRVLWYPSPYLTTSPVLNYVNNIFLHLIPAHCIDLIQKMKGEKPFGMFIYQKVRASTLALKFFCTNEWAFSTGNNKNYQQ